MIRIGSIVLRVDDLQRQTEFWEAALGYVRRDSGESDDFVLLARPTAPRPNLHLGARDPGTNGLVMVGKCFRSSRSHSTACSPRRATPAARSALPA